MDCKNTDYLKLLLLFWHTVHAILLPENVGGSGKFIVWQFWRWMLKLSAT
jgi:hypothetical protein